MDSSKYKPRMILNPDQATVNKIINRIYINNGNCPCQVSGQGIDTRCPCKDFTDNMKCHCSLFVPAE